MSVKFNRFVKITNYKLTNKEKYMKKNYSRHIAFKLRLMKIYKKKYKDYLFIKDIETPRYYDNWWI